MNVKGKSLVVILVVLICMLVGSGCVGAGDAMVTNLRCEYLENPQGIDVARPRLSWIAESNDRGWTQSAYQMQVAGTKENLEQNRGDLWDSGKVLSNESIHRVYEGMPLKSGMECFWKVRVWDQQGRVSAWSRPAMWSMGLLNESDWKAQWIGCPVPTEVEKEIYQPCSYLRKQFRVGGGIRRATLYATAGGVYEIYLNSRRVGEEVFAPGWSLYNKRLFYRTYDVTALLKENSDNAIAAILADGWYGLRHKGRGKLRLLAQLHLEYANGTEQLIVTDPTWKATMNGPILTSDMFNGEDYDARKEMPGWNKAGFDDSGWNRVVAGLIKLEQESGWYDVTEKVKAAVKDGGLKIKASNRNFGDPASGNIKYLVIEYQLEGQTHTATVEESDTFTITGSKSKKDMVILSARYGSDRPPGLHSSDLTQTIRQAHPGAAVRKTMEIKPVKLTEPKPGVYVFDMGQNMVGWVRLKVKGSAGTKVQMRFAEMLNPDGTIYTENLRAAKCTDTYICKGGGEIVWRPRFTFHGFRYVEVTGYPGGKPPTDAIVGEVLHSDCQITGSFECSNPLLNKLYQNIVWGQRGNWLEVPTDCPQRSERLGWMGDAQVFIRTASYNMDIGAFFTSWLRTVDDSQDYNGAFRNVSPADWSRGVAGWGDAGVICPWTIYHVYNDKRIIERQYGGMVKWIDYLQENSDNLLRPAKGYGDWLNLDAEAPKDVIGTAYFAYSTKLMAKMAQVIGKNNDARKYNKLFENIKKAFNDAYVGPDGKIKGETQTIYLMALYFDLLDGETLRIAEERLIELIKERDWHISIGFLGVNLLLPTLTDIGRTDVAYRLLQNEDYPSWLYPVRNGATTIWERWDGWTEEKGFQTPRMNSFNHYAYGACGQWMFSTLAGIDTDGPGYKKIIIRPRPGGSLTYAKAHYDSIHGRIATYWKKEKGRFVLDLTIPANTTATVYVPADSAEHVTESGKGAAGAAGVKFLWTEDGAAVYEVGSGNYAFVSKDG